MIHFIYGASGCGKSHHILDSICKDARRGVRSFLIVPEQQVLISEHSILNALPSEHQFNVEVLSFSRLYNRVCRQYGGLAYHYLTKSMQYLMMWETLRQLKPLLEQYGDHAYSDIALTDMMLSAMAECKSSGISSSVLEKAIKRSDEHTVLRAKLRDISLIMSAYEGLIQETYSDAADDLSKLAVMLDSHTFFDNSSVYIDSFTSFTATEHAVIDRIFDQAPNVTLSIPLSRPHDEQMYTASILRSEETLIKNAIKHGEFSTTVLERNHRTAHPELLYLSQSLWALDASPYEGEAEHIHLTQCKHVHDEVRAAARQIRLCLMSGYRCSEIAVIMRDASAYRGMIEPALEQYGIPYYLSDKTDLSAMPIVKFILSAIRIHMYGWHSYDVMSHIKTGMYDIPQHDIDLFDQYVTVWSIQGKDFQGNDWDMNADGYADRASARGKSIVDAANSVRRALVDHLTPFFAALSSADTCAALCRAVYAFLEASRVKERLHALALREAKAGNIKEATELDAVYKTTVNTLAELGEALGNEPMEAEEFAELLRVLFSKTEIGTIPSAMDQVTIGSASTVRLNNPKCVLVLGLCEGDFPATVTDIGYLSGRDRELLSQYGLVLSGNEAERSSDEYLYVYRCFTQPSEELYLYTLSSELSGKVKRPSLPFSRVRHLFPSLKLHHYDPEDTAVLPISPDGALELYRSTDNQALHQLLFEALANTPYAPYNTENEPCDSENCALSPALADEVFGKHMSLTQSKLESYAKCQFHFYCQYVLHLREDRMARFREVEIGTFIHYVLEQLVRQIVDENGVREEIDDEELEQLTRQTVRSYMKTVCPPKLLSSGRIRHLSARLRALAVLLLKNLMAEFRSSDFRPSAYEYKTDGKDGRCPPLMFVLKDGTEVDMSGVIDRVDVYREGHEVYIRVVDYKTGTKDFSLSDIEYGLNMQMLLYLFTLCASPSKGNTHKPAGIVYVSSNISSIDLNGFTDEASVTADAMSELRRRGLLLDDKEMLLHMNHHLDPAFINNIKQKKDGTLSGNALTSSERFEEIREQMSQVIVRIAEEIKKGSAHAKPLTLGDRSPCTYCPYHPICRRKGS